MATTTAIPAIGTTMPDGSLYAGVSPDTGRPMYTTPKDAPLVSAFNDAVEYASKLDAHGHKDWRVPTKAELSVLFQNRAAIGGGDKIGRHSVGWYWSSSRTSNGAWAQRFRDGGQGIFNSIFTGSNQSALRCVRG